MDKTVDLVLTVTVLTTLDEVVGLLTLESTGGGREGEGPEEGVSLLEVRSNGKNLVDEILGTDDTVPTKLLLDDSVVVDRDTLLVDLGESTLVDKLTDRLEVRVTPGDVGTNPLKHLKGSLGQSDESTRVDLGKTEKLQDLTGLGGNLHDTLDTNNKGKRSLSGDVEVTGLLGFTLHTNLVGLLLTVLLDVLLSTLEDDLTLGSGSLFLFNSGK